MSRLVFNLEFAPRADNTPSEHGYTYHHILPWRYYYATGVILAQAARRLIVGLSFSTTSNNARFNAAALTSAQKELDTPGKLAAAFGQGHEDFRNEMSAAGIKAFDLLTLCRAMHAGSTGRNNAIDDALREANGFPFGAIGNLCGAPVFGGFLAMAPEHRSDDPGTGPEKHRVFSIDETRWSSLQLLATHLRTFCPDLLGAKAGSVIGASVDAETFKLFKANLDKLVSRHNVLASFDPADWVLSANGLRDWEYIRSERNIAGKSMVGKVMQVRTSPTQPKGKFVDTVAEARSAYRIFSPVRTVRKTLNFVSDPR